MAQSRPRSRRAPAHRTRAPWYRHKHTVSVADMLAALRRALLAAQYQHGHPDRHTPRSIPRRPAHPARPRRITPKHEVITELKFQGTALGDQIVFTNKLLRGDTEVGHEGAVCTVTSVERQEMQCIATFSLRGGQITAQALVHLGDPTSYLVAVTGGSGRYEGAEGQIEVRPVTQDSGIHIFHLKD
jgi:hypothetical protein